MRKTWLTRNIHGNDWIQAKDTGILMPHADGNSPTAVTFDGKVYLFYIPDDLDDGPSLQAKCAVFDRKSIEGAGTPSAYCSFPKQGSGQGITSGIGAAVHRGRLYTVFAKNDIPFDSMSYQFHVLDPQTQTMKPLTIDTTHGPKYGQDCGQLQLISYRGYLWVFDKNNPDHIHYHQYRTDATQTPKFAGKTGWLNNSRSPTGVSVAVHNNKLYVAYNPSGTGDFAILAWTRAEHDSGDGIIFAEPMTIPGLKETWGRPGLCSYDDRLYIMSTGQKAVMVETIYNENIFNNPKHAECRPGTNRRICTVGFGSGLLAFYTNN